MRSSARAREWRFYLVDMIGFCKKVLNYTNGMDQEQFLADGLVYDASLRNLELIGEAASQIPDEVRERYPEIPWRMIVATRNRLIHGYLGIDNDTLWSIITEEVPALLASLEELQSQDG